MKLILSIFLSLLSLNLFAADGILSSQSGTTTLGTAPAASLPALGVAYPNALTNNSTVAWTNTDNITALTFSGAGSGQGILQLSNAAATGLTVILGPSNAFANTILASNTFNIYNGANLKANIDNSGNQTNAGNVQAVGVISTGSNVFTATLDLETTAELRSTNNAGTTGQLLTSAGSGKSPYWSTVSAANKPVMYSSGLSGQAIGTSAKYFAPLSSASLSSATEATAAQRVINNTFLLTNAWFKVTSGLGTSTNITWVIMTNGVASNVSINIIGNGSGNPQDGTNITSSVTISNGWTFSVRLSGDNPSNVTMTGIWGLELLTQ